MKENTKKIECRFIEDAGEIEKALEAIANEPFMDMYKDPDFRRKHAEKLARYAYVVAEYHDDRPVAVIAFYANDLDSGVVYLIVGAVIKDAVGITGAKTLLRIGNTASSLPVLKQMKRVRFKVREDNYHARRLYEMCFTYTGEQRGKKLFMEGDLKKLIRKIDELSERFGLKCDVDKS